MTDILLKEDSGFLLREDGSQLLLESAQHLGGSLTSGSTLGQPSVYQTQPIASSGLTSGSTIGLPASPRRVNIIANSANQVTINTGNRL